MKIVIDTTVIANGFHSSTADVQLLDNFLARTGTELCAPAIVIEEAVNLVRKAIRDANPKLADIRRLTGDEKAYKKLEPAVAMETYRHSIVQLLARLRARILDYPLVKHEDLVVRALVESKPFGASGRGYKDALIWFCVMELARSCEDEIIFISNNSNDFSQANNTLHSDLLDDLKKNRLATSRIRLFLSLGEFVKQYEIDTLPLSPPNTDAADELSSYQTLLVQHKESLETQLTEGLPEFLRRLSGVNARVDDLEVIAIGSPMEIGLRNSRLLDSETRVLEFSATYQVALEFLARQSDLSIWSELLSLHLRQEWDETRLRLQATTSLSIVFRVIERKKVVQDFSIGIYKGQFRGKGPVAVRHNQVHVHAGANFTDWGSIQCGGCSDGFALGHDRSDQTSAQSESISTLTALLSSDHSNDRPHKNVYDLAAQPS